LDPNILPCHKFYDFGILFAWFIGIGSWSDMFGFLTYTLLPGDRSEIQSPVANESENLSPSEPAKNQSKPPLESPTGFGTSDGIDVEEKTN